MATPKQFIETFAIPTTGAAAGTATSAGLASIPPGADNAILRIEGASCRWSETGGSMLTASTGLLINGGDAPFRIANLSAFRICALGSGGIGQVAYYQGFFVI